MKKSNVSNLLENDIVFFPTIYDCISARVAELAGFSAMFLNPGSLAYSLHGTFDTVDLSFDEILTATANITGCSPLPMMTELFLEDGFSSGRIISQTKRLVKAGADVILINSFRNDDQWLSALNQVSKEIKGNAMIAVMAEGDSLKDKFDLCREALKAGADIAGANGLKSDDLLEFADSVEGNKMWASHIGEDEEVPDINQLKKSGIKIVTFSFTERGTIFGMNDFGEHTRKDHNTVYHDNHDFDGRLNGQDYHSLFGFNKYWIPLEEKFLKQAEKTAKK